MIFSKEEFDKFIEEKYELFDESCFSDKTFKDYCPKCGVRVGLQIEAKNVGATQIQINRTVYKQGPNWDLPFNFVAKCPDCESYKIIFLYRIPISEKDFKYYKLFTIPDNDIYSIPELPPEYPSLVSTYEEAVKCMQVRSFKAAATMFRRALQIIVRDILGADNWKLADSLKKLKNQPNKLGVVLSEDFHNYSYIIKETGNQGAHPDNDIDLIEFTEEDATDLMNIFLEVVNELFIKPTLLKQAAENLQRKRKI